jgi:hypothetical protein
MVLLERFEVSQIGQYRLINQQFNPINLASTVPFCCTSFKVARQQRIGAPRSNRLGQLSLLTAKSVHFAEPKRRLETQWMR